VVEFKHGKIASIAIVSLLISISVVAHWPGRVSQSEKPEAKKVAIVIDDLGYNLHNVQGLYAIKKPITFSVLPNLTYSKVIAEDAARRGYNVMLHLPLESSHKEAPREKDTICVNMTEDEVISKLRQALLTVPHAKGVSNHMGSVATVDKALMQTIFKELKARRLYFLDSLVVGNSVCGEVADKVGIRLVRRDVYLDNINDASYIKKQFSLLIKEAMQSGSSIGIAHDRPVTVRTLASEMEKAEEEGIKFVFVSELVK